MKVKMTAEGMKLTESIKTQIDEKLCWDLDKYLQSVPESIKVAEVMVAFQPHKERFLASFNIALPRKEHIYAKTEDKSLEKALTMLREEIEPQLLRYKNRFRKL